MVNMASPGIIDLLYPGLEKCGIFKSVGHAKPWKIKYFGKFCICKLWKQGKDAYNQETLSRKMAKLWLWRNVECHDRDPGKVMEFLKLYR